MAGIILVACIVALVKGKTPKEPETTTPTETETETTTESMEDHVRRVLRSATSGEIAVVIGDTVIDDELAFKKDGQIYIGYHVLKDYVDERIYVDAEDGLGIFTNATDMIVAEKGKTGYTVNGQKKTTSYKAFVEKNGRTYVALEFVETFAHSRHKEINEPAYVAIEPDTSGRDAAEYTVCHPFDSVILGWAFINSMDENDAYFELTANTPGLNVYSPTWYFLANGDGGVNMLSDGKYVEEAHKDGIQVWALFSDVDYGYVSSMLSSTSKRTEVIDKIMDDMLLEDIDGVNIDFERITSAIGDDYIQFLRELSIRCRKEGKVLSVDNVPPYESRACDHIEEQGRICDYVCIMAYDDFVGTGEIGPNSSLPFYKKVADMSVAKVASDRLLMGVPFYSRIWYYIPDENGKMTGLNNSAYVMGSGERKVEEYGSSLVWDKELALHYGKFMLGEETAEGWFESVESIKIKLEALKPYKVAGVACWALGQEDPEVWEVINRFY